MLICMVTVERNKHETLLVSLSSSSSCSSPSGGGSSSQSSTGTNFTLFTLKMTSFVVMATASSQIYIKLYDICINASRLSKALWHHRSGSTLGQVMACCLMAPSHYLNQSWLIVKGKLQWNLNQYTPIFVVGNAFEIVVCKTSATLFIIIVGNGEARIGLGTLIAIVNFICCQMSTTLESWFQEPLLLTWNYFNPSVDK